MCGIFGEISINGKLNVDKQNFIKSVNMMEHRGPDDSGILINQKYAFGHRRLSIIDLTNKGRQPMVSNDQNAVITYNGEIYNYNELKKYLISKNFKFNNNTDTEVLLNGLTHEGPSFIKKCNGMFSFAYYNKKKKTFLIFRDRLGIKPLFYEIKKNSLIFSSNIKSICSFTKNSNDISLESVSAYFSFRQPINNDTFFKNIKSLEPGSYIEITNQKIKIKKYWDQKDFFLKNKKNKDEKYYLEKLQELLESSIKYRLISDVKVASLLSGGLDSSLIASILNKKAGKKFLAFSIGYYNKDYNEFKYSKLVAKQLQMNHKVITSTADEYFDDLDELINLRGQPLTIPNEASQFRLCKEIKKHATVVLSGSGADELFCGYGRIFGSVDDYEKLRNLKIFSSKEKKFFLRNVRNRYGRTKFKDTLDHFLTLYPYTNNNLKKNILSKEFNHIKVDQNINRFFLKLFNEIKSDNYLDKMQYIFQKYHLKGILEREDISSMATSVELRVPFLDHRVVEFAATIPNELKIRKINNIKTFTSDISSEVHDITKYILRKSHERYVPKKIYDRKKIGFPVPLHIWMKKKKIRDRIFDTLSSTKAKQRGIFNNNFINSLLNSKNLNFDGSSKIYQNSNANKIWMCYNLEKFFSSKY